MKQRVFTIALAFLILLGSIPMLASATVTPPEKPWIEKYVNEDVQYTLETVDEILTFDIIAYITKDAETVEISDTLHNNIKFVSTAEEVSVQLIEEQTGANQDDVDPAAGLSVSIQDKELTVNISDAETLRGKYLKLSFEVCLDSDVDFERGKTIEIDGASYVIDGENNHNYTMSSNFLWITLLELPKLVTVNIVPVSSDGSEIRYDNAQIELVYTDDKGEEVTVSGNTDDSFNLVAGAQYTLRVTKAPAGYVLPTEAVTFTVNEDGTIDGYDDNKIGINLSETVVQFFPTVPGTKYQITYKDKDGKLQYFMDKYDGSTEFISQAPGARMLGGFAAGVEYTVTFTHVDKAYGTPDNFSFSVDVYGQLKAKPIEGRVTIADDCIIFNLRAIPDRDGDGNHELDNDNDGIYEGSDSEKDKVYLPNGQGGYIEATGPSSDGTYQDKDGNKYIPVDKDGDGIYDGVTAGSTIPPTGDNSNMMLWFTLLFISGGAAVMLTVCDRKRRKAVNSK